MSEQPASKQVPAAHVSWHRLSRHQPQHWQFSLASLFVALLLFQISLVVLIAMAPGVSERMQRAPSLRMTSAPLPPNIGDRFQEEFAHARGGNLLVIMIYIWALVLAALLPPQLQRCDPPIAFSICAMLLVFAVLIMLFVFGAWTGHPSISGYDADQIARGLTSGEMLALAAVQSAPAVWILVAAAVIGSLLSIAEHPA